VWLEQEDAAALSEGEEVTLMDWGNAIVQVLVPPARAHAHGQSRERVH
jgi:glutamyl-tRNA synthetase